MMPIEIQDFYKSMLKYEARILRIKFHDDHYLIWTVTIDGVDPYILWEQDGART